MSTSLVTNLGGNAGFGESNLSPNDDSSTQWIDIRSVFPDGLNFFGTVWTGFYINNNGNITFNNPLGQYTPTAISGNTSNPMIAAFFADVDTRGGAGGVTPGGTSTGTNLLWYDLDPTTGTITITWDDVGYFGGHVDKLNAFQMQIVRVGSNDFDVSFRYEDINWTTGDASDGQGGLGGQVARAGYSAGDGTNFFELPQSGNQAGMLDLESSSNGEQPGLWTFMIRSGVPVIEVSIQDAQQLEGNGPGTTTMQFEVHLSTVSTETITVDWATEPGSASAADYQAGAGTVVFEPGQTVRMISVQIIGDTLVEPDENFFVRLSNPQVLMDSSPANSLQAVHAVVTAPNGPTNILNDNVELPIPEGPPEVLPVQVTIGVGVATGTIVNDDTTVLPSLSVNDVVVQEGDSGTSLATFTLSLDNASDQTITVQYATADGTAVAPADYIAVSGSVTFAPGQTSQQVSVQIKGDTLSEADEGFQLLLSGAVNATLEKAQGTATIVNDDALPVLAVANASAVEGTGAGSTELHFVFTLTQPAHDAVSVHYATSPGTALAGSDYTPVSGTLTFAVGEVTKEVVVQVVRDADVETDESFKLVLSQLTGPAVLGTTSAEGTIFNDDLPPALGRDLIATGLFHPLLGELGADTLTGGCGNDVLIGLAGDDLLHGCDGLDTAVFSASREHYRVMGLGDAWTVTDLAGTEGIDSLSGIERLQFADMNLALDVSGNAGQVWRLLSSAFETAPDPAELGVWISAMDHGITLDQVASAVMGSARYTSLHGTNPTDAQFVTDLYSSVLHRAPEAGRLDFWVSELHSGAMNKTQVMLLFSESVEHMTAVAPQIADGITYLRPNPNTGGAGDDVMIGTGTADTLAGGVGDDVLIGLGGNDQIDGGAGIDTAVYAAARADLAIVRDGGQITVTGSAGVDGTDTLTGVERLQLYDVNLAFDVDGNAGQIYRLYQAAFDRAPDLAGFGGWIDQMDHGMALAQVASAFVGSAEFASLYSASPTDAQFVNLLYANVLDRAPDPDGYDHWTYQLAHGMSREQALGGFSESTENQVAVIGAIEGGMAYLPV